MPNLTPNGLNISDHFPCDAFEAVFSHVCLRWQSHAHYEHFSGAWNALSYRFEGAVSSGNDFVDLLKTHGPTPPPTERYKQEHALFSFFSSGFSAVESLFYGLFAIGSFLDTAHFSLAAAKDQQKVSPKTTIDTYKIAFPGDPILSTFNGVTNATAYLQWREIRNILTHRTAPGRRVYLSLGSDETLVPNWKLNNIPIDESLISARLPELGILLGTLLTATDDFIRRHRSE